MNMLLLHVLTFVTVVVIGAIVFIKRKSYTDRMFEHIQQALIENPSRNHVSEYFVDAFEREFKELNVEYDIYDIKHFVMFGECRFASIIIDFDGLLSSEIICSGGCSHVRKAKEFLLEFNGKTELEAIEYLMKSGCFATK